MSARSGFEPGQRRAVAPLTIVRDAQSFVRAPIGRCHVRTSFLIWRASEDLSGIAFWGRPSASDARELIALLRARHASGFRDVATITDARGLAALESDTFGEMARYLRERPAEFRQRLGQSFLLLDPTPVGAMVAGVNAAIGQPDSRRSAGSYQEILVEIGDRDALRSGELLEASVREAKTARPFLSTLRDHLHADLAHASVTSAARALGVSPRSLQRSLASEGSSFIHELRQARLKESGSLLLRTDWKVELIASRVGFSSASHFRRVFKDAVGVQPSEYRDRSGNTDPVPIASGTIAATVGARPLPISI